MRATLRAKEAAQASFLRWVAGLSAAEREALVRSLSGDEAAAVAAHWPSWAHDGQLPATRHPPPGTWRTWMIMGGRGFGKTHAGAEWIAEAVRRAMGRAERLRTALVGATIDEARRVMVEGPSGLLSVGRELVTEWHPSRRLLRLAGGSEAQLCSGASPESLRGPEHNHAWCDELAKRRHAEASWVMLQLGLRVGAQPRALITTTPRDGPLLGRILAEPGSVVSGGATGSNPHLPPAFVAAVGALYGGTRLGREEIDGAYDGTVAGQLFPPALIAACRVHAPLPPELEGLGEDLFSSANDMPSPSPLRGSSPPACGRGESFLMQTSAAMGRWWWPRSTRAGTWSKACCAAPG